MGKDAIAPRVTGHIITHNHWDRDWVLTEIITQKQAVGFFTNLWKMMEREPEYKMVLDGQAEVIDDYLAELPPAKRPGAEKMLAKHIGRGKLMAGPTYIQPDFVLISGETHVRNLLIGHNVAKKYGNVMKVGWLIDTFGHISQTPPTRAKGTESITISVSVMRRKFRNNSRKMVSSVTGMTTFIFSIARSMYSNWPLQVT